MCLVYVGDGQRRWLDHRHCFQWTPFRSVFQICNILIVCFHDSVETFFCIPSRLFPLQLGVSANDVYKSSKGKPDNWSMVASLYKNVLQAYYILQCTLWYALHSEFNKRQMFKSNLIAKDPKMEATDMDLTWLSVSRLGGTKASTIIKTRQ